MTSYQNPYAAPATSSFTASGSGGDTFVPPTWLQLLFSFKGRIRRTAYWISTLILSFVSAIVLGIYAAAFASLFMSLESADGTPPLAFVLGFNVVMVPVAWASFALIVKRLHDRGKTAWWLLLYLVPLIGPLWLLIEAGFLPGEPHTNAFGADPKSSSRWVR